MPACPFDIVIAADGVAHVSGTLDETVTQHFGERVSALLAQHHLVLDLSLVDYLPSSALTWLVRCLRAEDLHELRIRAQAGSVAHRVLSITGIPFQEASEGTSPTGP